MSAPHVLCLRCRRAFTDAEIEGHSACPGCGSRGIPADTNASATITLTHHELRVLCMWAQNWQDAKCPDSKGVVEGIVRALREQHPGLPALSLFADVKQCVDKLGIRAEVHQGGTVTAIEPERQN